MRYLILALLIASPVHASEIVRLPSVSTLKAIYKAAKRFGVDSNAMIKIAYVESSFKADARKINVNGSIDYGLFQINSVHWSTTCRSFDIFAISGNTLCAAKLLSLAKRHAVNDPTWLGRYHSKTPKHKIAYFTKLASLTLEY